MSIVEALAFFLFAHHLTHITVTDNAAPALNQPVSMP
jgi:hypothetical protein